MHTSPLRQKFGMLAGRSTIQLPDADQIAALRAVPMFADLSSDSFAMLAKAATVQLARADEQILREGGRLEFLYVLIDGLVELYSEYGKDSFGFMLLRAPSVFILAPILLDAPCLNSARAIRASKLVLLPARSVKQAIADDPAFARAVECEQALAYRYVLKELKNRKFRTTGFCSISSRKARAASFPCRSAAGGWPRTSARRRRRCPGFFPNCARTASAGALRRSGSRALRRWRKSRILIP